MGANSMTLHEPLWTKADLDRFARSPDDGVKRWARYIRDPKRPPLEPTLDAGEGPRIDAAIADALAADDESALAAALADAARCDAVTLTLELFDAEDLQDIEVEATLPVLVTRHLAQVPGLLDTMLADDPPRGLPALLRALVATNLRAVAPMLEARFDRIAALGESALWIEMAGDLGDPALLPRVIAEWHPLEAVTARTAGLLARLAGTYDALPAAIRAAAEEQARREARGLRAAATGLDAMIELAVEDALLVQVRCDACGRDQTVDGGTASVHPDRPHCEREGWDGVMFGRVIRCRHCGAEDRYALTTRGRLRIMAETMRTTAAKAKGADPSDVSRVRIGVPTVNGNVPIRRVSEALAYWRERIATKPGDASAWVRLGNVLKGGDEAGAIAAYERAAALDENLDALGQWFDLASDGGAKVPDRALTRRTVAALPRGNDDPDFRGAVALGVAQVLEAEVARGASLGLRARWVERGGRASDAAVGEVDLRRVRNWDRLGAFLGAPTTVETQLIDGDACAPDTGLERLLASTAPLAPRRGLAVGGSAPAVPVRAGPKVGRNDPCPCGSGKKFKKCCGA